MSLKRKIESSDNFSTLEDIGLDSNHFPLDKEINEENDSADEERESEFEDDIDDDFGELYLDSDDEDDGDDEAAAESDSEWEDIEEKDEKDETQSCGDSAYIGSSKEDVSEEMTTNSLDRKKSKHKSLNTESIPSTSKHKEFHKTNTVRPSVKKNVTKKSSKDSEPQDTDAEEKSSNEEKRNDEKEKKKSMEEGKEAESAVKLNEYEEDSSDEEDLRNTIGNIPINWYDDYEHLGYGLDSLPILKPEKSDTLEKFLDKLENPDYDRTVFDKKTGQDVVLSDAQFELAQRILNHRVPNPKHNFYEPFHDLYSHEVMQMPLSGRNESKRSFLPVKSERDQVMYMVHLIKKGLLKRERPFVKKVYFDLWKPRSEDAPRIRGISDHVPAPKAPLPGHGESYNPPPEYLMSDHDVKKIKGYKTKSDEQLFSGFWRKFQSVREIPLNPTTFKERNDRLFDLYLAPRKRHRKVVAKPADFLPDLPDKKDLRPYPTVEGHKFKGHESIIRTISIHPSGKFLASGSDDHTVRIWEVNTGRCLRTFNVEEMVRHVSWNPNPKLFLLSVALGLKVVLLNPETYLTDKIVVQQTNAIFKEEVPQGDYIAPKRVLDAVKWRKADPDEWAKGYRVVLDHFKAVKELKWHRQGDYFATVIPDGLHRSVLLHQLSRWRSHQPFKKNKGRVETVSFHPKLPQFFVASQAHIRVYDLKRLKILKRIQANSRWVSCLAVHPGGEHFLIGGYDRRVNWFELECTKRPHLMRPHASAVRSLGFHRKYPLYATCSDDGRLVITHATVYDDWLKDPLIVPLKNLRGHEKFDDLWVLDVVWHPYEPYLLTAGADGTIRLWH